MSELIVAWYVSSGTPAREVHDLLCIYVNDKIPLYRRASNQSGAWPVSTVNNATSTATSVKYAVLDGFASERMDGMCT